MKYPEFRDAIHRALRKHRNGLTWPELRDRLSLPYTRPCPEWTKQLEQEIGLTRTPGTTRRALIWKVQ
ncbi:MAG TPA: hypothetical protein VFE58_16425 [Tepidisphaeraceae bacterium]|jgi:hypothetical protein|nr:hypothetical protein [Tepidisphaeraceae bacterium]